MDLIHLIFIHLFIIFISFKLRNEFNETTNPCRSSSDLRIERNISHCTGQIINIKGLNKTEKSIATADLQAQQYISKIFPFFFFCMATVCL